MQGLADGYFVIPHTLPNYLATITPGKVTTANPEFKQVGEEVADRTKKLLSIKGKRTVDSFHRELGMLIWEECGMARSKEGLEGAIKKLPELREEFWSNVFVPGEGEALNQSLEKAGRVADFLEFGELMCRDALAREESCGGHFRTEYQTPEGEALRKDDEFAHVSAWEYTGEDKAPVLHKEELVYEEIKLQTRSYK